MKYSTTERNKFVHHSLQREMEMPPEILDCNKTCDGLTAAAAPAEKSARRAEAEDALSVATASAAV